MANLKKWELLEEQDVSPSRWFPLFKQKVKLPSGKVIDDYYVSRLGDVAMILAITDNQEIVFVRQYKQGAREFILELPAGRLDGKTPEEGARAELEEETGIKAENLIALGWVHHSATKDSVKVFGFLVTNAIFNSRQKLDETEDIEVVLVPVKDVEEKIKNNELNTSDTNAFLYMAKLKYPELFI